MQDQECDYRIRMIRLYGGRYNATAPCTSQAGCVEPASLGGMEQFQAAVKAQPGWQSFTDSAQPGGIAWGKVVAAGHSQGAGMALLVGQQHALAQVVQLAGVDDISGATGRAAPWVRQNGSGATAVSRVWGLGNVFGFCCEHWHATWPSIGMAGPMVSIDGGGGGGGQPFGGSRQFCSRANSSGISGHGMPLQYAGYMYADVWTLMLTGQPPHPDERKIRSSAPREEGEEGEEGACACPPAAV